MNEKYLNVLNKLRPIDDTFMRMIFRDHQCVELLMKIVFGEQFSLKRFETQEDHKQVVSRSVELDIVVYTHEGAVIGIEVEKSKDNASPLRARYHASVLDCDLSYPKEKWKEFPEIYVVFICEEDVLKNGKMLDHIQRYREDGNIFGDKLHIIYLNASMQDETALGKLMHDMLCSNPNDMYYEVLRKRVSYFKRQEGGKKTMCEALEELITEAKNEGRKEGEDIGEKRGKLIGEEQGEIKKLMKLLLKKFPNKNFEWVKECSKTQLEKIDDYIFLNISYNDFYKLIHS
ncbi:PD-(D/E)XK nuclease family transposase [Massilimicrobiota timonensis]|uniref:PD-(D/E)XK nuclease family transposase n=1 Tax=Massilimicrobiota timonensis TaxID=1776392 RepID=UPI001960F66A|nr:PD-(D/E)XK nuclease family transposase [Massilimicrobiota timonensis]MBM6966584.1 PD-(D/E)XK nuclease family transposase [Massilimicrobiota timonensis]